MPTDGSGYVEFCTEPAPEQFRVFRVRQVARCLHGHEYTYLGWSLPSDPPQFKHRAGDGCEITLAHRFPFIEVA